MCADYRLEMQQGKKIAIYVALGESIDVT